MTSKGFVPLGKKIIYIQFDKKRVGHGVYKALILFFFNGETQLSSNVCFLSTDSNSILKQGKVRSNR